MRSSLEVDGGTCVYNGTGTITTATVAGVLDFIHDTRPKTVTNCTVKTGATLNVDEGVLGGIVFTTDLQYPDDLDDVEVRTPAGVKGTLTYI